MLKDTHLHATVFTEVHSTNIQRRTWKCTCWRFSFYVLFSIFKSGCFVNYFYTTDSFGVHRVITGMSTFISPFKIINYTILVRLVKIITLFCSQFFLFSFTIWQEKTQYLILLKHQKNSLSEVSKLHFPETISKPINAQSNSCLLRLHSHFNEGSFIIMRLYIITKLVS